MDTAEHLRWQAHWCRVLGSDLYGSLLDAAAGDVEARGPTASVLEGFEASFHSMLALRMMGAVHRLVLLGDAPDLARFYPSAGGSPDPDGAWDALSALLEERGAEVRRGIERPVQTNEAARAAALVGGFLHVARATGLPLRILEVGASAGLLLRWDHFRYEARGLTWGPPGSPVPLCSFNSDVPLPFDVEATVVERAGCDPAPVDPTTDEGAVTLTAYVWPDQLERLRLLKGALTVAREVPAGVDRAGAAEWLEDQGGPSAGVATVVYHSIVMQYLSHDERAGFDRAIARYVDEASPTAPFAWLRFEPGKDRAEVRLALWPGGGDVLAAISGFHGQNVRWLLPDRVADR